jgi:hypothetical protein
MTQVATAAVQLKSAATRTAGFESTRALILPFAFTLALGAFVFLPAIRAHQTLFWSIAGAAAALLLGNGALLASTIGRRRTLTIEIMLRKQHYLQACAQGSVLLYWGWHWRQVYDAAPLIAAQLVFAYAFDMLLAWSRRDTYTLGFAPFPVIFSINLFLWFKPDWFYLQFLMIAVGFAAKELIRWEKDGRRAHIFNPSSFPLAVFSVALILTGTTSWTWGPEIARTQFNPPNIYVMLFLVGLPGQYLFGVTTMTMSAVLTTYLFGLIYFALTGAYFFVDSYVPIAVFLGMHLLFTDPSTSPRTELGRIFFGMLYGLGNVVLYEWLGRMGVPTFYDKLLPVPIMNVSIKLIDRAATSQWLKRFDPARLGRTLAPRRRNLAYIGVWSLAFIALSATDGLGDAHPGHRVPFWQQACQANARHGCANLAIILDTYCRDGSSWACNEVGTLRFHGRVEQAARAAGDFGQACALGLSTGCQNAAVLETGIGAPRTTVPRLADYPIILRVGKGQLPDRTPVEFLTRACQQGFMVGCEDLGAAYLRGEGTARDPVRAASAFEKACSGGLATACSNLGLMHYTADGIPRNGEKGVAYLKNACDLGHPHACRWLKETRP